MALEHLWNQDLEHRRRSIVSGIVGRRIIESLGNYGTSVSVLKLIGMSRRRRRELQPWGHVQETLAAACVFDAVKCERWCSHRRSRVSCNANSNRYRKVSHASLLACPHDVGNQPARSW